jgi:hypothetical protein
VNHIEAKQQWNMQTRLFNRDPLIPVCLFGARQVDQGSNLAASDTLLQIVMPLPWPSCAPGSVLHQLADFFRERHLAENASGLEINVPASGHRGWAFMHIHGWRGWIGISRTFTSAGLRPEAQASRKNDCDTKRDMLK